MWNTSLMLYFTLSNIEFIRPSHYWQLNRALFERQDWIHILSTVQVDVLRWRRLYLRGGLKTRGDGFTMRLCINSDHAGDSLKLIGQEQVFLPILKWRTGRPKQIILASCNLKLCLPNICPTIFKLYPTTLWVISFENST